MCFAVMALELVSKHLTKIDQAQPYILGRCKLQTLESSIAGYVYHDFKMLLIFNPKGNQLLSIHWVIDAEAPIL